MLVRPVRAEDQTAIRSFLDGVSRESIGFGSSACLTLSGRVPGQSTSTARIKDVAARITPLTDLVAHEMIRSLKTFPLLDGYQGAVPCELEAIEDVLIRVGAMVQAHPEIVELDCNPLIAGPDGATIVDARVRIAASDPPPPVLSLRA